MTDRGLDVGHVTTNPDERPITPPQPGKVTQRTTLLGALGGLDQRPAKAKVWETFKTPERRSVGVAAKAWFSSGSRQSKPGGNKIGSQIYSAIMGFALFFALTGGALFQIFNLPDDPWNPVLDGLMIFITACFMLDLSVLTYNDRQYPNSFYFWMDILGTISMIFEISYLLGPAGKINTPDASVDTTVMRAARTAKIGARSGRLVKLLKCLSFIFGTQAAM